MRVFLLDASYKGDSLYSLKSKEKQYLNKVLRLEVGTVFTAKDKSEQYYNAKLIDQDRLYLEKTDNIEENLMDALSAYKGPFANISMYICILKGKKNELVAKALTEIGIKKIVFVQSQYVQEKEFSSHQKERIEAIVREAVQQSGAIAPVLDGPIELVKALEQINSKAFILHQSKLCETKSLKQACSTLNKEDDIACFIGPEGGFSEDECSIAVAKGAIPVLLNTNILRAETAAIYTASALQVLLQG
mgnify:FL=1